MLLGKNIYTGYFVGLFYLYNYLLSLFLNFYRVGKKNSFFFTHYMRYAGSIHNRFFCKWPYSLLSQISLSKTYTGTGAESFRNPNTNKFLSDPPDCRIYSLTVWYWGDDEIHRVLDYFQWNDHVLLKRCILFFLYSSRHFYMAIRGGNTKRGKKN